MSQGDADVPTPGGGRELLRLALPLILSSSFWTIQILIDRVLLARQNSDSVGAAMMAVMLFWTPLTLFQNVASYATTFVAQYTGAGRPRRVGPAVWQALYFAVAAGLAFMLLAPCADALMELTGHSPEMRELEATYFRCLCFAALPMLIIAAVNSFFGGRGDSWTVLCVDATGTITNAVLAYCWIFGRFGFPAWGIAGAGWATVCGSWVAALTGLVLFLRRRYRAEFATLAGWRPDPDLFKRLLRFGLPNGIQWCLEGLAFTVFILLVGRLGSNELAASGIAFTINLVAFLPMFGLAQAVSILVGQRLGADQPEVAERTTYSGLRLAFVYMASMALFYLLWPGAMLAMFEDAKEPEKWSAVAEMVVVLLRFIAVYALADSVCLIFSFALRGAGDTLYVTVVSLSLAWPVMVLPTWFALEYGWGLYWSYGFVTAYILAMTLCFVLRFRAGKWKSMRVIEQAVVPDTVPEPEPEPV
jgi:MATE family multidrug resistance protein